MFIANQDVAEFKKGDIVPDDRAKVWIDMFLTPPVDKVGDSISTTPAKTVSKKAKR